MADIFKGIITADGKKRQLPYRNVLETPVSDKTLEIEGAFADSKEVGERFAKVNETTDSLKEDISNKITKFYANNQGETHITDSDNGKIMDMMVYGKSEQKQYTGKNLLELSDNQVQNKNLKFQISQGIITFSGSTDNTAFNEKIKDFIVPSDGTYTISTNSNSNNDSPRIIFSINNSSYEDAFNGTTKELTTGDVVSLRIRITAIGSYNGITIKPMIEKGSEVTSYEPYTGGQPSPSPDYPQEIKSVVNPTVKVCGKNLLKPTLETGTKLGITYTNNGDGTYTLNGTAIGNAYIIVGVAKGTSGKKYKISGCPLGGDSNSYFCALDNIGNFDTGNGVVIVEKANFLTDFLIVVKKGITLNNIVFKPMLSLDSNDTYDNFEPYRGQTVTLPYTLNAVPASAGGNVTIDGQQYIADYVDVERGKLVKMVDSSKLDNTQSIANKTEWLLAEPQENDLTTEQMQALKELATYYPTTNISVNSEQLDGYTVFNYPISMANGWNYVKKQLNDNRDYIYDMDLQSAEAYVNSEYAVALTELEV